VDIRDSIIKDISLEDISVKVKEFTGVTVDELKGKSRNKEVVRVRSLFILLSKLYTESLCNDIANYINREPWSLGYIERILSKEELNDYI